MAKLNTARLNHKITPFHCFDTQAEEAAQFHVSVFEESEYERKGLGRHLCRGLHIR